MRLSMRPSSPFYNADIIRHVDACLVDGQKVRGCFEASEEGGWALCRHRDANGKQVWRVGADGNREPDVVELRGNVEIVVRPDRLSRLREQQARHIEALRWLIAEVEAGRVMITRTEVERNNGPARWDGASSYERYEHGSVGRANVSLFFPQEIQP